MRQRLIGAAVLVPIVVLLFLAGDVPLTLGIAALAALAAYESGLLLRAAGFPVDIWLPVVAAPVAVVGMRFVIPTFFGPVEPFRVDVAFGFVAVVLVIACTLALRARQPRDGLALAVGNVVATLYPSLLAFLAATLSAAVFVPETAPLHGVLDDGRAWLLVLVLTVWALDSAAFLAGRYHGRGRFMNHISPNKTWSGALGGTAAAMVVCTALMWAVGQNALLGPGLGLLIATAAQAGDLFESMLKRAAGVKDSGTLIPGHGGVLDRVDSFLFAGPAMILALALIAKLPT